ncbi:hypothetical protein CL616_02395, partial [archaeon]|nr:hypothetical protein [archaeon]
MNKKGVSVWLWAIVAVVAISIVLAILFWPFGEGVECVLDEECGEGYSCSNNFCLEIGVETDYEPVFYEEDYIAQFDLESEPQCGDGVCEDGEGSCLDDCGCVDDSGCESGFECVESVCFEVGDDGGGGAGSWSGVAGGGGTEPSGADEPSGAVSCVTNDDCAGGFVCEVSGTGSSCVAPSGEDEVCSLVTQVTDNELNDLYSFADSSSVLWSRLEGLYYDVYLYDILSGITTQLTFTEEDSEYLPSIDGDYIVWLGHDGTDYEVYLYQRGTGTTTQLTDNIYNENFVKIDSDLVVWGAKDGDGDYEIYYYDMSEGIPVKLTDNVDEDLYFDVDGNFIVWNRNELDVYLYEVNPSIGGITTQLSNFGYFPKISGSNVIWREPLATGGYFLKLYNKDTGAAETLFENEEINDFFIDEEYVVWMDEDGKIYFYNIVNGEEGLLWDGEVDIVPTDIVGFEDGILSWAYYDGTDYEVHFVDVDECDTSEPIDESVPVVSPPVPVDDPFMPEIAEATCDILQVTDNELNDLYSVADSSSLVWSMLEGLYYDVYFYELLSGETRQLTFTDDKSEYYASVDGIYVVWLGHDGDDYEVYMWEINPTANFAGGILTQLTDNDYNEVFVQIDGDVVVWSGSDGDDEEIYSYSISNGLTTQITDNEEDDSFFSLYGSSIVWNIGREVYLYERSPTAGGIITRLSTFGHFPKISESNVIWRKPSINGNFLLIIYDIDTGVSEILIEKPEINSFFIDGDYVVWMDEEGKIYFYNLLN